MRQSCSPGFPYPTALHPGALSNKISCFVSTCVSSYSSFLSVRQEPFWVLKGVPLPATETVTSLLCQAKWEHSRLLPLKNSTHPPPLVSRERFYSQEYMIRIKAFRVLYSFFCKVSKGWVADKIRVCAGSQVV